MIIADYQERVYDVANPCWHLVADVLVTERGLDLSAALGFHTISNDIRQVAEAFRLVLHKSPLGFDRVSDPVDYAVVLMGKTPKVGIHHCGIYYDGKVLHALQEGTLYQDESSLQDTYAVYQYWAKP